MRRYQGPGLLGRFLTLFVPSRPEVVTLQRASGSRPRRPPQVARDDPMNRQPKLGTFTNSGTRPKRTPEEQRFLDDLERLRKLENAPPMTIQEENLTLDEARAMGDL